MASWDDAASWGDHAAAGYLKAVTKPMVEGVLTGTISSHSHDRIASSGRAAALTNARPDHTGISMVECFQNDYPASYGNVLQVLGARNAGAGQLLLGWAGVTGARADIWYRNIRDTNSTWSAWEKLWTSGNLNPDDYVSKTGNSTIDGVLTLSTGGTSYAIQLLNTFGGGSHAGLIGIGDGDDFYLQNTSGGQYADLRFNAASIRYKGKEMWHAGNFAPSAKLDVSAYTSADVLSKLKGVDGAGSGLDADLLDGLHAAAVGTVEGGKIASFDAAGTLPATRLAVTDAVVFPNGAKITAAPNGGLQLISATGDNALIVDNEGAYNRNDMSVFKYADI